MQQPRSFNQMVNRKMGNIRSISGASANRISGTSGNTMTAPGTIGASYLRSASRSYPIMSAPGNETMTRMGAMEGTGGAFSNMPQISRLTNRTSGTMIGSNAYSIGNPSQGINTARDSSTPNINRWKAWMATQR